LADQLSVELFKAGFDVYLDRFTTLPGVNFVQRLTQELADKAMVVVLESRNIALSSWTMHEISYAKSHRLGLLALHLPGGAYLPQIGPAERMPIAALDATTQLFTGSTLQDIVDRIRLDHAFALRRKRLALRDAVELALLNAGVTPSLQHVGSDGLIHASSPSSSTKSYSLWVTPRPPVVDDFHLTHTRTRLPGRGIVVGPLTPLEATRALSVQWLSSISNVHREDEGQLLRLANDIAGGSI
jgi:hypothetical protein